MPSHPLTLQETFDLGRDHLGARFHAPDLRFEAGQWGNLRLMAPDGGEQEKRAMSFASPPAQLPVLELCVRRQPHSHTIAALEAATSPARFEIEGPFGAFRLLGPPRGPVLLVATSTGIAPLRSLLLEASSDGAVEQEALLLHATASDRDPPYAGEAPAWQERWPRLRVEHRALGQERDESDPETWSAVVQEALAVARGWPDRNAAQVYLAGHGGMTKTLRGLLQEELGLERDQVRAETFWP